MQLAHCDLNLFALIIFLQGVSTDQAYCFSQKRKEKERKRRTWNNNKYKLLEMAKTINACDDEHLCGDSKIHANLVLMSTRFLSSAHVSTTCVCACYQMGNTLQGYAFNCAKYTLGSTAILF